MEPLRRVLVISPHFDDGVFGCGDLLARHPGSIVVTVFAAPRPCWDEVTPWDRSAGFQPGVDVVAARRREDQAALAALRARPCWLDFRERQYGGRASAGAIRDALRRVVDTTVADAVFLPLGLWHSEHCLVHDAAVELAGPGPALRWFAYDDAIYRRFADADLDGRLRSIEARGLTVARPTSMNTRASGAKRRAIDRYASQLRALAAPGHPGYEDAFEPETYRELRRSDR